MRSRAIKDEDVALWAGKSKELLDQLTGTSTDALMRQTGGDGSNPCLPPGHRNTSSRGTIAIARTADRIGWYPHTGPEPAFDDIYYHSAVCIGNR